MGVDTVGRAGPAICRRERSGNHIVIAQRSTCRSGAGIYTPQRRGGQQDHARRRELCRERMVSRVKHARSIDLRSKPRMRVTDPWPPDLLRACWVGWYGKGKYLGYRYDQQPGEGSMRYCSISLGQAIRGAAFAVPGPWEFRRAGICCSLRWWVCRRTGAGVVVAKSAREIILGLHGPAPVLLRPGEIDRRRRAGIDTRP